MKNNIIQDIEAMRYFGYIWNNFEYFNTNGNESYESKSFQDIIEVVRSTLSEDELIFINPTIHKVISFHNYDTSKKNSVQCYFVNQITSNGPFNAIIFLKDIVKYYYENLEKFIKQSENDTYVDVEEYLLNQGQKLDDCVKAIIGRL